MNSKYYEIARKIYELIKNDPKYEPSVRQTSAEIVSFKRDNIPSWYLVYLMGLAKVVGVEGMEDYKPLEKVDDILIHYAINDKELFVLSHKTISGKGTLCKYYNLYRSKEESFIKAWLDIERKKNKIIRIIAYKNMVMFIPETAFERKPDGELSNLVVDKDISNDV